ncbi:MAG TPA: hypothetical protein DCZ91_05170 [Lachnospiraceae bacterium]|nr:hypothetical protein [Lachnospiraceae bacterium]
MNTYYQVLGLEPGASQLEIKKAYFKMIRQHSPESDPEQFQKIREAYEQLKNAGDEPDGPVFPPFSEPFAEKMMDQIANCRKTGDSVRYRDTAQEAWKLFPKDIQFLYHLVLAQRKCGNTGKAVKNAELLVSMDPQNKWFQRELAVSYIERGFTQKAYWACEKAYELGCRDLDFVLMYASECDEYGEFTKGRQILTEIVRREKRWAKEEIPELLAAYHSLLELTQYDANVNSAAVNGELPDFAEIIGELCHTVEKYSLYMDDFIQELGMIVYRYCRHYRSSAEFGKLGELLSAIRKAVRTEEKNAWLDDVEKEFSFQQIDKDPQYSDTIKRLFEACTYLDELPAQVQKFAVLDCRLCMIEEREEILGQEESLRNRFPVFWEQIRPYLEELKNEEQLPLLKDKLLKTYRRIEPDISGGYYYEKYPAERIKSRGIVISDGMSEQPYVRAGKKVGRNDPCPCGSGKKYKNCCMNKKS